jgi:hypothetical protein
MTAFSEIAGRYAPQRRKRDAARPSEARDETLEKRNRMVALWCRWRQQQVDDALLGPHGSALAELMQFLGGLTLETEPALVELVRKGPWRSADPDTRYLIMRLVGSRLAELREAAGLPPFSDPLPGDPPNAFLTIRELLR